MRLTQDAPKGSHCNFLVQGNNATDDSFRSRLFQGDVASFLAALFESHALQYLDDLLARNAGEAGHAWASNVVSIGGEDFFFSGNSSR